MYVLPRVDEEACLDRPGRLLIDGESRGSIGSGRTRFRVTIDAAGAARYLLAE